MIDYKLLEPYLNNEQFCQKLDELNLEDCYSELIDKDTIITFTQMLIDEKIDIISNLKFAIPAYCFNEQATQSEYTIPSNIKRIYAYAFAFNFLDKINLSNNINLIGEGAFRGCSYLKQIQIPPSVTTLFSYTFKDCTSLQSVLLPGSINYIDDCCFSDCLNLHKIEYNDTMDSLLNLVELGKNVFDNVPAEVIHCIDGNVEIDKLWRR